MPKHYKSLHNAYAVTVENNRWEERIGGITVAG